MLGIISSYPLNRTPTEWQQHSPESNSRRVIHSISTASSFSDFCFLSDRPTLRLSSPVRGVDHPTTTSYLGSGRTVKRPCRQLDSIDSINSTFVLAVHDVQIESFQSAAAAAGYRDRKYRWSPTEMDKQRHVHSKHARLKECQTIYMRTIFKNFNHHRTAYNNVYRVKWWINK